MVLERERAEYRCYYEGGYGERAGGEVPDKRGGMETQREMERRVISEKAIEKSY